MRVYIVRHGESVSNQQAIWTGWADVPLTEKGKEDAKHAGEMLKDLVFDKIYTSDLMRAIQTAEIAIPNCQYEVTPLAREINVGKLEGQPFSVVAGEISAIVANEGFQMFGGESRADVSKRIQTFMGILEASNYENVAVFAHGGWLRGFLDAVMGIPMPRKKIRCNNCMVAIFEYEKSAWRLHSWINL